MKKIIAILLVLIMAISCTACGSKAESAKDIHCPGFIGLEHLDVIKELDNRIETGELQQPYTIEMGQVEGYWAVYLTCELEDDTYEAVGLYDHMPTQEEFDILWENRVPWHQLSDLLSGLGI